MTIEELKEKRIGILGLGVNNQLLTAFLARQGCALTVREDNLEQQVAFQARYPDVFQKIAWQKTGKVLEHLTDFEVVFRSPGIPFNSPEIQKALKEGVTVYSQTKLFFDLCPATIIGVTGTKGKGTTSSLIQQVLSRGYKKGLVYVGGNIGVDPFAFYEQLTADDVVVLELSSFQLQDLHRSPHVAVVLNVGSEHLDHHQTMAEYQEAKMSLVKYQKLTDTAIINADGPHMKKFIQAATGTVYTYSRRQARKQAAWVDRSEGREVVFVQTGNELDSFDITDRQLLGEHNLENLMPAALVGKLFDIDPPEIRQALVEFSGLEHRLSLVGSYAGLDFYDDSFATIPESTIVAVKAFAGKRVHLIVGGNEKGGDFKGLASEIVKRCASISLLPGTATKKLMPLIKKEMARQRRELLILDKAQQPLMPTILSGIHPNTYDGDIVLLSPAATSFASFKNYKERGDAFVQAVRDRYDKK